MSEKKTPKILLCEGCGVEMTWTEMFKGNRRCYVCANIVQENNQRLRERAGNEETE